MKEISTTLTRKLVPRLWSRVSWTESTSYCRPMLPYCRNGCCWLDTAVFANHEGLGSFLEIHFHQSFERDKRAYLCEAYGTIYFETKHRIELCFCWNNVSKILTRDSWCCLIQELIQFINIHEMDGIGLQNLKSPFWSAGRRWKVSAGSFSKEIQWFLVRKNQFNANENTGSRIYPSEDLSFWSRWCQDAFA